MLSHINKDRDQIRKWKNQSKLNVCDMTRVAFSLETNELLGQVDFVLDRLACMIGYHYQFGTKEEEKKRRNTRISGDKISDHGRG